MQDRPTATELLAAVRHFLEHDILPATEGRRRFHTLVAANVLHIVERELRDDEPQLQAEWQRLASLPGMEAGPRPTTLRALRDSVRTLTTCLAERIRTGAFDEDPAVRSHLIHTTREKLRIANPKLLRD